MSIQNQKTQAKTGNGSTPHEWSAISQARLFSTTLISEKYDGTLILGRGLPTEWLLLDKSGVSNYKLSNGSRVGYKIRPTINNNEYEITFFGKPNGNVIINSPVFTSSTLSIVNYKRAPKNHKEKVLLIDTDNDGRKEIQISEDFDFNNKIVFYLETK